MVKSEIKEITDIETRRDLTTDQILKRMMARYYMKTAFPFTAVLIIILVFLVSLSGSGEGIEIAGVRISPININAISLIIPLVQNYINQVFTSLIVMNNSLFGYSNNEEDTKSTN